MNLLQSGPAETTNYMLLGLAFVFVPMALHIWSLISRNRSLKADLQMLEEMEK